MSGFEYNHPNAIRSWAHGSLGNLFPRDGAWRYSNDDNLALIDGVATTQRIVRSVQEIEACAAADVGLVGIAVALGKRFHLLPKDQQQIFKQQVSDNRVKILQKLCGSFSAWETYLEATRPDRIASKPTPYSGEVVELAVKLLNQAFPDPASGNVPKEIAPFSDATETLAIISKSEKTLFEGVPFAITRLLRVAKFTVLSGDDRNVLIDLCCKAGLHPKHQNLDVEEIKSLERLLLLGRYGKDKVIFCPQTQDYVDVMPPQRGIPADAAIDLLNEWQRLTTDPKLMQRLNPQLLASSGGPTWTQHGTERFDNLSFMFYLFGTLDTTARGLITPADRAIMEEVAQQLNQWCEEHINKHIRAGRPKVIVATEGSTTIATRTADKGDWMANYIAAGSGEILPVYFGDTIINGGNDFPAYNALTRGIAVQVGKKDSWLDPNLTQSKAPVFYADHSGPNGIARYFEFLAALITTQRLLDGTL